jgi:hypothetical protein
MIVLSFYILPISTAAVILCFKQHSQLQGGQNFWLSKHYILILKNKGKELCVRFEASAGVAIFSFSFWVVTQRGFSLVSDQRFGIECLSHHQGPVKAFTGP